MLYYEAVYRINLKDENPSDDTKEDLIQKLRNINDLNNPHFREGRIALVYSSEDNNIHAVFSLKMDDADCSEQVKKMRKSIAKIPEIKSIHLQKMREITGREIRDALEEGENGELVPFELKRGIRVRDWDFLSSYDYSITENVVDETPLQESEAEVLLNELMADKSLREEISRIYDKNNSGIFYGYPVHYKINAGNLKAAEEIVKLLVRALHTNNRVFGTRVTTISQLSDLGNRGERGTDRLISSTSGTAVLIEMLSNADEDIYATASEQTVRYFSSLIEKYHDDTLFFLFENTSKKGFGKDLVSRLEGVVDLIELDEGRGNRVEADAYMKRLIRDSRFSTFFDDDAYKYLQKKKSYHASDVQEAFEDWKKMCLKKKAYRAYDRRVISHKKQVKEKKRDAYQELQDMAGLRNVKDTIDDILSFYRIKKIRDDYHVDNKNISKHMVFTGNPGCAKTTVARLLSEIMLEEGIISTGAFVECGRSDLVGKYVGWTAKEVKAKFTRAKGGILFIDEAYSLVDDSHSYGDEAINTIVQEMENHRDDVTVIFAGYPMPMESFLNRNEGLRSRIAFHLEFPDYNTDELIQIFSLMIKEMGYTADEAAQDKCRKILESAINRENFGNGRFVRNLVEHAIMKQSGRLLKTVSGEKPSKESVTRLLPEDFDMDYMGVGYSAKKLSIGFNV